MMINLKEIKIVKAGETDTTALTEISFVAKRHWKYPEHLFCYFKAGMFDKLHKKT